MLLSEDGPNFSNRHVTVSTSGIVPEMRRFGEETDVKLAVSLNATTDEVARPPSCRSTAAGRSRTCWRPAATSP